MDGQIISQREDVGGVDMPGSLEALGMVLMRTATCRMSVMSVWAGVVVCSTVEASARSGAPMYSKMYIKRTIVSLFWQGVCSGATIGNIETGVEQRKPSTALADRIMGL